MKCNLTKMRRAGVALPKYELGEAKKQRNAGDLAIIDTRENNLNRIVKLAKFTKDYYYADDKLDLLYEPHIVWMSEDRFMLTGFEQVLINGKLTDYAQSWLCDIDVTAKTEDETPNPPRSERLSR